MRHLTLKRFGFALLATLVMSASALASPAQDLFDQAVFYLQFHYGGFSSVDLKEIEKQYQQRLDRSCASQGEACPYAVATEIIGLMLREIRDGHTNYWSKQELEEFTNSTEGDFGEPEPGLGLAFVPISRGGDVRVLEVFEDSAAGAAGVQRGDRVLGFNGQRLPTVSENAFYDALHELEVRERAITLSVVRNETDRLEITVRPRVFAYTGLPWMQILPSGYARIVVPDFDQFQKVGPKLHQLVERAQRSNVRGIVVDLRDNSGGFATECLSGVSAFVPDVRRISTSRLERIENGFREGTVYSKILEGGVGVGLESVQYRLNRTARWTGPLAVLVNQNTGSCAELFAVDVQYANRGPVIGEPTAGVGNTSTRFFGLIDGSALQITVSKTTRLDGTPYPERVTPDIRLRDDPSEFSRFGRDTLLERALGSLTGVR